MISIEGQQRSVPVVVRASNSQGQGNHAATILVLALFDYLVSERLQCGRQGKAKLFRGFEVDDKFVS
jgi:hypothetical protein